jgi:hypothetical protein
MKTMLSTRSQASTYVTGGIAAILMLAIIIIQMVSFIIAPPPYDGMAADWFEIFRQNSLVGLIDFELLMVIYTLLSIPIALTLYRILKDVNPYLTSFYMIITTIGVISFLSARPAFEMLHLSQQYAAAATEAERAIFLAAGEATLAAFNGTAFHVSYLLGSLGGLLISLVMLKASIFSKVTAYIRIASSICDLGLYIPVVGLYISIFSVLFLFVWNMLIAIKFFQLDTGTQKINEIHRPGLGQEGRI